MSGPDAGKSQRLGCPQEPGRQEQDMLMSCKYLP